MMHTLLLFSTLFITILCAESNLSSGMRLQRRSNRKCRHKTLYKESESVSTSGILSDPYAGIPKYSAKPDRAIPVSTIQAKPTITMIPVPKKTPVLPNTFNGDQQFSGDCLRLHNQYRLQEGVAPVVWDNQLASKATAWANSLTAFKRLAHSNFGPGENLFHSYRGDKSCAAALGSWYNEKRYYRRGQKVDPLNSHKYGHFTQMIWKQTTHVGCGYADSGDDRYTVCQYLPRGNLIGMSAY